MLGAIAGDIAGSVYEFNSWQGHWRDIPLFSSGCYFTDDTVLSLAVARGIICGDFDESAVRDSIIDSFHVYGRQYSKAGYGHKFAQWLISGKREPYNSYGNGAAMRVSPVGWAFDTLEQVEKYAEISSAVTHNHPEGIKGACSVAGSVFLARTGKSRNEIKDYAAGKYGYDLDRSLEQIRESYRFDETCQRSVPEAIIAFLESENFEEAIRKAIWLRGDADTQAAISGSIAEAFYGGVPAKIAEEALSRLDDNLHEKFLQWQAWLENHR